MVQQDHKQERLVFPAFLMLAVVTNMQQITR